MVWENPTRRVPILNPKDNRVMTLMTWMIFHPQMALVGHHIPVEMKYLTHTHPLKQRIGINTDIDPIVVIRLDLITIGFTMGGVPT